MLILGQKPYFLGPTIFKIPQPYWHYYLTLFLPAMGWIIPYTVITWHRPVGIGLRMYINKDQWHVFIWAANSISLSILVWLYCSLYRGVVPPPYLETWPTTIHVVWKRSLLFRKRVHGGQCVTRWSPKMDGLLRRLNPSLAPIGRCSMKELWFAFRSSIRILKVLGILENEN